MGRWRLTSGRRFAAIRQLGSLPDKYLAARIILFAASVPALLRLGIPRLQSFLEPGNPSAVIDPARIEKIAAYVNLLLGANLPFIRSGCLIRGITLYYFLRRSGLELGLSFGIGNIEGRPVGHCWLVKEGAPFLESQDPRPVFTEIFSIPLSRHAAGSALPKSLGRIVR